MDDLMEEDQARIKHIRVLCSNCGTMQNQSEVHTSGGSRVIEDKGFRKPYFRSERFLRFEIRCEECGHTYELENIADYYFYHRFATW
jgi:uncharacterized Zn finger protein